MALASASRVIAQYPASNTQAGGNPRKYYFDSSDCLALVKLTQLMELTRGRPEIVLGLIDGPVNSSNAAFDGTSVRHIPAAHAVDSPREAREHGTFIAGILSARRGGEAPSICPGCTLLVRPILTELVSQNRLAGTQIAELAAAIVDCVEAGAHVLNLSLALINISAKSERTLDLALRHAAKRGVLIVAAAGNQGAIGGTLIAKHPWIIPVAACGPGGAPLEDTNLGASLARNGLRAPGMRVTSVSEAGTLLSMSGTSVAAPFVTGAIGLLWSLVPSASAVQIRHALTRGQGAVRTSITPPLLDGWSAYRVLRGIAERG